MTDFYGHLVHFIAISYILWPFGMFCGHFGIFSCFWYVVARTIWQPWQPTQNKIKFPIATFN
jgi:hypothetical protein